MVRLAEYQRLCAQPHRVGRPAPGHRRRRRGLQIRPRGVPEASFLSWHDPIAPAARGDGTRRRAPHRVEKGSPLSRKNQVPGLASRARASFPSLQLDQGTFARALCAPGCCPRAGAAPAPPCPICAASPCSARCPHRGVFVGAQDETGGQRRYRRYTLGAAQPWRRAHHRCMGARIGRGPGVDRPHPAVARGRNGDSTFYHTGLQPCSTGITAAIHHLIVDNRTQAMTGPPHTPGTGLTLQGKPPQADLESLDRAQGISTCRCRFTTGGHRGGLSATPRPRGPAVVISRRECALRPRSAGATAAHGGGRTCTACGSASPGCPALSKSTELFAKTGRPKARSTPCCARGAAFARRMHQGAIVPRVAEGCRSGRGHDGATEGATRNFLLDGVGGQARCWRVEVARWDWSWLDVKKTEVTAWPSAAAASPARCAGDGKVYSPLTSRQRDYMVALSAWRRCARRHAAARGALLINDYRIAPVRPPLAMPSTPMTPPSTRPTPAGAAAVHLPAMDAGHRAGQRPGQQRGLGRAHGAAARRGRGGWLEVLARGCRRGRWR